VVHEDRGGDRTTEARNTVARRRRTRNRGVLHRRVGKLLLALVLEAENHGLHREHGSKREDTHPHPREIGYQCLLLRLGRNRSHDLAREGKTHQPHQSGRNQSQALLKEKENQPPQSGLNRSHGRVKERANQCRLNGRNRSQGRVKEKKNQPPLSERNRNQGLVKGKENQARQSERNRSQDQGLGQEGGTDRRRLSVGNRSLNLVRGGKVDHRRVSGRNQGPDLVRGGKVDQHRLSGRNQSRARGLEI